MSTTARPTARAAELARLTAQQPWLRQRPPRSTPAGSRRRCAPACAPRARRIVVDARRRRAERSGLHPGADRARCEAGAPRVGLVAGQRVGRKDTGFKKLAVAHRQRRARRRAAATARATPAAASRRSAATSSWRCPISTACIASCRRWSGARATTIGYVDVVDRPRLLGHFELRHVGPAVGRHSRSRRRVVADPRRKARAATLRRFARCSSISRTPSATICTTCSSTSSTGGSCSAIVAQILFTMRFVVQWIASERAGRSVIPIAFWIFSIGGGADAAGLCARPPRPGLHPRPGVRPVHLSPQHLLIFASAQAASAGRAAEPHGRHRCAAAVARKARARDRRSRSSTSSSPMWKRSVGPPGAQCVAVR